MKVTIVDVMGMIHRFVGDVMDVCREARENGIAVAQVLVDDEPEKDEA